MLDPKLIRNNPDAVKTALKKRGEDPSLVDKYLTLDEQWRGKQHEIDELRAKQNKVSDEIAKMKKEGTDANKVIADMKKLSDDIKEQTESLKALEQEVISNALVLPNIPDKSVPEGKDSKNNIEVRKAGKSKTFDFKPKTHDEIGKNLGILDFESAARVSGSRFTTLVGLGAKLERALISFMLDLQTKENGYTEVMAPFLVSSDSMLGTGQLPKFEEDLFKCRDDDLYLVPTAEVSVTNLMRQQIVPLDKLPINYASFSPCFRREAGSYGKDVKGLIRQHQFNKVELVKFVEPKKSYDELEKLTLDAESVLKKLGLPYRVVLLCTGDMGFAAAKTYDLEVWFPSEKKYREISSCSNFEDFQARRAAIRFRKDQKAKPEFVHTLNGSGLAIGRTLAAILENYQTKDGNVEIPEALRPYMDGCELIQKDHKTT